MPKNNKNKIPSWFHQIYDMTYVCIHLNFIWYESLAYVIK